MRASDIPTKLQIPFASGATGGFIRAIPEASQIGVTAGAASLTDGFVPLNATPIEAGGVPPSIKDMNGILFEISGWSRWGSAGAPVYYDADFATAIGGYPLGAVIQSAATPGVLYLSTADNNETNPEGGGAANWETLLPVPATLADLIAGVDNVKYTTAAGLAGLRATQAQVLAGVDGARFLTPLSFFQSRAANADILAGVDDHKYLTALGLAQAFTGDGQTINLPGGRVIKLGVLPLNHPNTSTTATVLTFATPFTGAFGGVVGIANGPASSTRTGVTITGQGFNAEGGTLIADTGNDAYGINNPISAYWIAWGTR
jgi:hypothetical protein